VVGRVISRADTEQAEDRMVEVRAGWEDGMKGMAEDRNRA